MAAEDFGKPVQDIRLVASGEAYLHPALVWGFWVKGTAGATCTLVAYDGFSTSDVLRYTLVSTTEGFASLLFPRPVAFHAGIYLAKGAGASEVGVLFDPLKEA